jgi:uncharacterized membrane protein
MTFKKKAIQLGSIKFDSPLWVLEYETPSDISASMVMTAANTHVVYESEINTPYITLISKANGWIEETTKNDILALYSDLSVTDLVLTYSDTSTDTVRIAREKGITFAPIYEGACVYTTTINLAKKGI